MVPENTNPSLGSAPVYAFLGLFAISLAVMKFKHEMYLDEGQAWLITRDSAGLFDLVHHLRYEGHPAFWYLVLYLPAHIFPRYMVSMLYISLRDCTRHSMVGSFRNADCRR